MRTRNYIRVLQTKGHPAVVDFIVKTVEEETSAIDSLKNLRDQAAHGKDNNTGYVVVTRYFKAVEDSRKNLEQH